MNYFSRGGRKFAKARKSTPADEEIEKLLCLEQLGPEKIAISFKDFFSMEIKNAIKDIEGSCYDAQSKIWIISADKKSELIEQVGQMVLEHDAKIFDVPEFVTSFYKNIIPFTHKTKKVALSKQINYLPEVNKFKDIDDMLKQLPPKLQESLY